MSDRAIRDLTISYTLLVESLTPIRTYRCPPESSVRDAFQILPSRTLTSRPSVRSWPSGGCSLAKLPGSNSPKIRPKSLLCQLSGLNPSENDIPIDLLPGLEQGVSLVPIKLDDSLLNHRLILQYCSQHLLQSLLLLLDTDMSDRYRPARPRPGTYLSIMFMTLVLILRPMPFC
jgi:hypothetical protein